MVALIRVLFFIWGEFMKDILEATVLPNNLRKFDKLMREIPNFDKRPYNDARKIYSKDEFIILRVTSNGKVGYIVYNTKKSWSKGHTHLKSYSMCEILIKNVINKKKPKSKNFYLLDSHIRISNDLKYVAMLENLKAKEKKQKFYKKGGGKNATKRSYK